MEREVTNDVKTKKCRWCGASVTGRFFGYPAVCDSDECNEEDRQHEIAIAEQAEDDAREDDYARYM